MALSNGFIENKGQYKNQNGEKNNELKFLAQIQNGISLHLYKNYLSYELKEFKSNPNKYHNTPIQVKYERVGLHFKGCNENIQITSSDFKGKERYFLNGENYTSNIYKKVTYKNLYDNVDLELIIDQQGRFKYNFLLHHGANVSDIQLYYKGLKPAELLNNKIILKTSLGNIIEEIPKSWILNNDQKNSIDIQYIEYNDNTFGFQYNESDWSTGTLVIDPMPHRVFGTYMGGSLQEEVEDIVLDEDGNSYIVGHSQSTNNIATTGTYQGTFNSVFDVYIIKHDVNGNKVWGTYFGGTNYDRGYGIDYHNGVLYIAGSTYSFNMTTPGVHQENIVDGDEAFLAKFDTTGNIVWSTYYAGEMHDFFADVHIDSNGDVYCTGHTFSQTNMATAGAYQTFFLGVSSGLVVKFDSNGVRLWGTYYGQSNEEGWALDSDSNGNIYATGYTTSSTGIATTSGVHQSTFAGGADAYLAKFSPTGSWIWGTYYGGTGNELSYTLSIDASDNIYIGGNTTSPTNIHFNSGYQNTPGSVDDNFVAQFSDNGTLNWGTYIGGNEAEYIKKSVVHPGGGIIMAGLTQSQSIGTPNAYQENHSGNYDAFLTHINSNGGQEWLTYYGDINNDEGRAVGLNPNNNYIYFAGVTKSNNNISSAGSEQEIYGGGNSDGFLTQMCAPILPEITTIGKTNLCKNDSALFVLENTENFNSWQWSDGSTNDTLLLYQETPGIYSIYLNTSDTNACPGFSDTFNIEVFPVNDINFTGEQALYCSNIDSLMLGTDYLYDTYLWSSGGNNDTLLISNLDSGILLIELTVTDNNSCGYIDSLEINVSPTPNAQVQVNGSANFCLGETVDVSLDQSYDTYEWYDGQTSPQITLIQEDWVWAIVSNSFGCTDTTDSIFVDSDFLIPEIVAHPTPPYCDNDSIFLSTTFNYNQYVWSTGGDSSIDTLIVNNLSPGVYNVTVEVFNACGSSAISDPITFEIFETQSPTIDFFLLEQLCVGASFFVFADPQNFDQYTWMNGETSADFTDIAIAPGFQVYSLETIDSNGCTAVTTDSILIDTCYLYSYYPDKTNGLNVYPNPSHGKFYIEIENQTITSVQVFGQDGKKVYHSDATNGSKELLVNIEELSNGTYTIKVETQNLNYYRKILIIK